MSTTTRRATPWRLEWRLFHADTTVRVLAVAFVGLVAVAAATGRGWVAFQRETLSGVLSAERLKYDSMATIADRYAAGDTAGRTPWTDPRLPNVVAGPRGGRYVALPPTPLAAVAIGQSDVLPYYTRVTNGAKLGFAGSDEIENPLNLLSGRFDLAFAIVVVFPLIVLVLTFNVAAGEREGGTLGLLLAQPEAPGRLLGRKLLLRGGSAIGVAVLGTLVAALATGGGSAPGRLALLLALVAAYGLFWLGIGAAINAAGRGSGTSAVMALAAWLVVVVLAPTLFGAAVSATLPPPSRVALMTELRETSDAVNARGEALLQKYFLDHPEMMGGGSADLKNFALRAAVVAEELDVAMAPAMT
nr:ABC transporter permease subunit [Gemmatimonadaceae bacterium]